MKNIHAVIGFFLLAGIIYCLFQLIQWCVASARHVDPTVGTALIVGATTIVSSVYIASFNARKAKERAAYEAHREKKAEVYTKFMDMMTQLLKEAKAKNIGNEVPPIKLEEFFMGFTTIVMIYGGPGVVKAYGEWRTIAAGGDGKSGMKQMDKLFRAMREDLGESNKGLEKYDLIGLLIVGGKAELERKGVGDL